MNMLREHVIRRLPLLKIASNHIEEALDTLHNAFDNIALTN